MTRRYVFLLAACFLCFTGEASAHRLDEYLQATILSLQASRVKASMRMIPGVLEASAVIQAVDRDGDGTFSSGEERTYALGVLRDQVVTLNGVPLQPHLVSWQLPQPSKLRDGVGEIHLDWVVDLPRGISGGVLGLANHHRNGASVYLVNVVVPDDANIRLLDQKRNPSQSFYQLHFQIADAAVTVDTRRGRIAGIFRGVEFRSLFTLGMHHIAEGTDHLLFLFTLLLPAPLLALRHRWTTAVGVRKSLLRIAAIVTAFTVGHSVTLTFAAMGWVRVPSRPVEVLIAVSILVAAVHALRPILPGREALIAAFFGLIHGLAFAATLDRLGLGAWERIAGILSFNLGIEAMQLLVVAAVLPSLLLLSRSRVYTSFRTGAAACAGVASLAWIAERLFDLNSPIDTGVNALARHGVAAAVALLIVSALCRLLLPVELRLRQRFGLVDGCQM